MEKTPAVRIYHITTMRLNSNLSFRSLGQSFFFDRRILTNGRSPPVANDFDEWSSVSDV
jgi:hypothetical protein